MLKAMSKPDCQQLSEEEKLELEQQIEIQQKQIEKMEKGFLTAASHAESTLQDSMHDDSQAAVQNARLSDTIGVVTGDLERSMLSQKCSRRRLGLQSEETRKRTSWVKQIDLHILFPRPLP